MKKYFLLMALFVPTAFILAGDKKNKELKKLEKEEAKKIQNTVENVFKVPNSVDLPIPQGFKIKTESFLHKASSFRYGTLYFSGDLVIGDTEKFYIKQMANFGWEKGELSKKPKSFFKYSNFKLVFYKKREVCTVTIGKKSNKGKTEIVIDIKASLK